MTALSDQQTKIYEHFRAAGVDVDLSIASIFFVMGVNSYTNHQGRKKEKTQREKHQQVGSAISRLNKVLCDSGWCIKPGVIKQTYRLTQNAAK